MADIEASEVIPASGGTVTLDESRSYTICWTAGTTPTLAVDGGTAVAITAAMFPLVVGPGVGKLLFGLAVSPGNDLAGAIFPRSDSRM